MSPIRPRLLRSKSLPIHLSSNNPMT
jgi:hypothetical protein